MDRKWKSRRSFLILISLGFVAIWANAFGFFKNFLYKVKRTLYLIDDKTIETGFYHLSQNLLSLDSKIITRNDSDSIYKSVVDSSTLKSLIDDFVLNSIHQNTSLQDNLSQTHGITEFENQEAIKIILQLWYTGGVHDLTQPSFQRVLYEKALMHKLMSDSFSPPGFCGGNFGFWSKPPQFTSQIENEFIKPDSLLFHKKSLSDV